MEYPLLLLAELSKGLSKFSSFAGISQRVPDGLLKCMILTLKFVFVRCLHHHRVRFGNNIFICSILGDHIGNTAP